MKVESFFESQLVIIRAEVPPAGLSESDDIDVEETPEPKVQRVKLSELEEIVSPGKHSESRYDYTQAYSRSIEKH